MRAAMYDSLLRFSRSAVATAAGLAFMADFASADSIPYSAAVVGTVDTYYNQSYPTGLNNSGQLVGGATDGTGPAASFLYSGGQATRVYVDGGPLTPSGIDDSGKIVAATLTSGSGVTVAGNNYGSLVQGSNVTLIPPSQPGAVIGSTGVNNSGQVVGSETIGSGNAESYHPFLYSNGTTTNLGVLPGWSGGYATAINNLGQIVGGFDNNKQSTGSGSMTYNIGGSASASGQAFLYNNGQYQLLGTLGGAFSLARAINDSGLIVGQSSTSAYDLHAFLDENGKMLDLNSLVSMPNGLVLTDAVGVNNNGQIAAIAYGPDGLEHAVLLTPNAVPEPTTLAFAAAGGALLVVRRLRRGTQS